ncbi:MAG: hypothetical protein A2179_02775 [Elusimicrobia bacterium GWC2_63_65]|nr:MAG: hypothetical protein A2179_02775 [Elusimicrobia bacterium GWC2_63_65]
MKLITLLVLLSFASTALLQAKSLERMRTSSENINIETSGLKAKTTDAQDLKNKSTGQYEIAPVRADGLAQLIVKLLKLIFNPNGDIEMEEPPAEVPQTEGSLDDDQEEETYSEGQTYEPVKAEDLPQEPFAPRAQPQTQGQTQQEPQVSFEPGGRGGDSIPADLKRKALEYFNANSNRIENKRYLGVVDFAAHSSKDRFWILDMQTGTEHAMHVAHGTGSDPDGDGYATKFSNTPNSKASSLGFYLTGALYTGKHGKSMRLHGLSSTNSNALSRAVVVHDSNYVREANVRQGRSFGCLAVANTEIGNVLASLRGGALIYAGLSNSDF